MSRFKNNYPLTPSDRSIFYLFEDPAGYIDYLPYEQQNNKL